MKKLLFIVSLLCTAFMVNAQVLTVSGYVTDSNGAAISNVPVIISAPYMGQISPVGWTITNGNGYYFWVDTIGVTPINPTGTIDISITDCNGLAITQTMTYSPNLLILTANFTSCTSSGGACGVSMFTYPDSINPLTNYFSATTTGGTAPYTYSWDFGDNTTGAGTSPIHTYAQDGLYYVCVTTTDANGCSSTDCQPVFVLNITNCYGSLSYNQDTTNAFTMYFDAFSTGVGPFTYSWDFGDNTSATTQSPSHTYTQSGVYTVCVTITDSNGCAITDCQSIYVDTFTPCFTTITVSNPTGNPLNYTFSSSNGNAAYYLWDFGDGIIDTTSNPTHTFAQTGTYYVCVTESDSVTGCTAMDCIMLTIGSSSCQAFISASNLPGSSVVDFYAIVNGNTNGVSYFWDFGDGNTSTLQNPTHVYNAVATGPVTFLVTLVVTDSLNNCSAVTTETVSIFNGNITGQILGYLWKDTTNLNPADGLVYLIEYDSINGGTLTAIDTIQTQQGFFHFQNVPMGTYLIKAALLPTDPDYANYLPTYFVQSLNWSNAQYVGPIPFGLPALIDIQLIAGNNPGGPGFIGGLVVNGAGRPINGTVTLVEDILDLEPMEGVSVLLLDANDNAITHTVTAADGSYSFSNIAMGTYNVHVEEVGKVTYDANVVVDANGLNHTNVHFTVHDGMVTLTGTYDVTNVEDFQVYPNPVSNTANVQLQLKDAMDLTLSVSTLMGQEVLNQNMKLNAGTNTFSVEMSDLPAGLYLLSLKSNSDIITYKIQKM